jgi:hypothetical protein
MALTPYSPHPNLTVKIAADKIIMRKQVSSFSKNLQVLSLPIFKLLSFTSPFLKVQTLVISLICYYPVTNIDYASHEEIDEFWGGGLFHTFPSMPPLITRVLFHVEAMAVTPW